MRVVKYQRSAAASSLEHCEQCWSKNTTNYCVICATRAHLSKVTATSTQLRSLLHTSVFLFPIAKHHITRLTRHCRSTRVLMHR